MRTDEKKFFIWPTTGLSIPLFYRDYFHKTCWEGFVGDLIPFLQMSLFGVSYHSSKSKPVVIQITRIDPWKNKYLQEVFPVWGSQDISKGLSLNPTFYFPPEKQRLPLEAVRNDPWLEWISSLRPCTSYTYTRRCVSSEGPTQSTVDSIL